MFIRVSPVVEPGLDDIELFHWYRDVIYRESKWASDKGR
jgi:hypothetical protein